ncbi:Glycosyltransferase involved in cell wall bisynthesis [Franzmannia pantelleriensis]|uniref:Glycosyltransferase involved in cell wall bisynthesis n=1 Tax=Franzmannia pantelleriensis TaxID=48727 RepID=A0A1G9EST8_9GAMM|nr:glycosyltransferase family 4 protein [Halomonas pantelleriensis]SDK79247.1 Glycosyltransferase involved in cell wall bisynthesis [Halomonas pantelleriensis]
MTVSTCRIAHLQLLPLLTGVQRVSLDELERLPSSFIRSLICQGEGALTAEARACGIEVLTAPHLQRSIRPLADGRALWQLWRYFHARNVDVVHTHSSKTGVLGRLAACLAGVPCIVHTVHGFAFPAARSGLQRRLFQTMEWLGGRCAHRVICLHEGDARICLEQLKLPAHKVVVLPNGVDLDKYRPPATDDRLSLRCQLGLPRDRVLVTMVGRLWEQKDPGCLVDAYCALWEDGDPGADLVLVGDGELQPLLEERVARAGLAEHVHFLGWRSDTPELLRASDMFVLPSRWEGMPLAILEAMATGLAVVVSDIPGNRHLVSHADHGVLFPAGDHVALGKALQCLLAQQDRRHALGRAARLHVETNHDIRMRVRHIEALYHQVLQPQALVLSD